MSAVEPPYYILFSHSPLTSPSSVPGAPSSSLGHPVIQYHYADDSPLSLLPNTPDEHVLVLDYDPTTGALTTPTVRSTSKNMAVTGLKMAEAPGAAAADEGCDIKKNDRMYILETTTCEDRSVRLGRVYGTTTNTLLCQMKVRYRGIRPSDS